MAKDILFHRWFVAHPASVGESYAEHFGTAARFGARMVAGGLACLIHAVLPGVFVRTGSDTVKALSSRMTARQSGTRRAAHEQPDRRPEYEI